MSGASSRVQGRCVSVCVLMNVGSVTCYDTRLEAAIATTVRVLLDSVQCSPSKLFAKRFNKLSLIVNLSDFSDESGFAELSSLSFRSAALKELEY